MLKNTKCLKTMKEKVRFPFKLLEHYLQIYVYIATLCLLIYVARVRFGIRVRVRRDSVIKKLLKIFLFIFFIYFYY